MALPADEFAPQLRRWFPMAMHLIEGMLLAQQNSQIVVGQREKLVALGSLTAGLTHELNNPAAAAVRATASLRDRMAGMRRKLALLAKTNIDADALARLVELQEDAVKRVADAPTLSPLETSDREDDMGGWLEDHGVDGAWELAPVFVGAGLDARLDGPAAVGDRWRGPQRLGALAGLQRRDRDAHVGDRGRDAPDLDAGHRRQELLAHGPCRSRVGRRPRGPQEHARHAHRTGCAAITVVKEFDRTLPKVLAYPGELNQVWTNIIDNAAAAMNGSGTLTIRTSRDGDRLLVEICDTGPGIPPELQRRIFEPFFTTKGVGEGTGLGLDISWKIVVNRHGGDLRVVSSPGDTRFQVRLPLRDPDAAPSSHLPPDRR